jgi:hypothetical protein
MTTFSGVRAALIALNSATHDLDKRYDAIKAMGLCDMSHSPDHQSPRAKVICGASYWKSPSDGPSPPLV